MASPFPQVRKGAVHVIAVLAPLLEPVEVRAWPPLVDPSVFVRSAVSSVSARVLYNVLVYLFRSPEQLF